MSIFSFVSLLLYSTLVAGQSYGFVYPSADQANLVFELGQNIDIQWKSPFKAINLAFIAEDGPLFQFFSQNNKGNQFTWAVNVNNSGSSSPYYYLYFENAADNSQHDYSALFRVDDPLSASSPTAAATVTVTPSPSLKGSPTIITGGATVIVTKAVTLSPTTASTAAASSTNSADSSTGLSRGAKIGIGLGVPLGILILVGLAFLAVWSSWRHSRAAKRDAVLPGISNLGDGGYATDNIPVVGGAGYLSPPGYSQQGAKLTKPHGYVAVQQYPLMSELPTLNQRVPGVQELPHGFYEPRELDATNTGIDSSNRGYR
ncbi:hypothetical protein MMC30_001373 [Trapelia coarctata]|nr:hypothetical protein [Trapelia coarctata]